MSLLSFGQDLVITGIIDAPLPGGTPKGLELYVVNDIPDLSVYGIESTTNGAAAAGVEYTFPADAVTAGSFIYLGSEVPNFTQYLGIAPTYVDGVIAVNGDDTVILYLNGVIEDSIGEIGVDGTGETWDHVDGWAYRIDGFGPNATFSDTEWIFSGANALDGCDLADDTGTNAGCSSIFPIGTYSPMVNTNATITITSPNNTQALDSGTASVDVEFTVANAPGATVNISVTTNGGTPVVTNGVTSPFTISPTADGDTFNVSVDLVDGGVLDSDAIDFSIAYPCTLQVGTITETCDSITPATTDTYNVTIEYTGGGTSTYTIDTGGNGTVGGDDPTSVTDGTITISGILEGTDFTVNFLGDAANSSCDFNRNINSPNCDPQLMLPLYDDFSYADGSLTANPNWTGFSGNDGDLLVTSGQALVQHGTPSEDANIAFSSVTGDVYYAFDFSVNDPGGIITGGDYEYFAVFKDDGFGFRARIDIAEALNGGDFTVGISSTGSTADAVWPTDFSFGTTYRATVRYNQDTNIAELWIDASTETDTSILGADEADPGTTITQFALRQSDSSLNEGILIDNLAITQSFDATLSTEDITIINEFSLYPNPTDTGFVTISSSNSDALAIQVFDILGKQVKNEILTNNTLDVSNLTTGIYIVKITQDNASTTKKLVIR